MKENVRQYSLSVPSGAHLSVLSPDADVACRLDKPDGKQPTLYCNNKWDYPEIAWGNFCKVLSPIPTHGTITLRAH